MYPDLGQALYASSKAALNHLTYHLASELWDIGVRVNAVAPDTFPGRVSIDDIRTAVTLGAHPLIDTIAVDGDRVTVEIRAREIGEPGAIGG